MANPLLPTSGTHELQERYANAIVALKRPLIVVRNLFRKDYEGDPKAGAVKIPKRNTEVVAGAYNVQTGKALTFGATEYVNVLVDQDQAVNELIDGYEAAAVPDNVVAQRLDSAAYSLAKIQELYAIAQLEAGTAETATTNTVAADMYATIIASIKNVAKLGILSSEIKVLISDDTWEKLLTDAKFTNTASQIGAERAMRGVINEIGGCEVFKTSSLTQEGATAADVNIEYIVFATPWAQTVEDWKVMPSINDLKDGVHIGASALQGRMVYKDVLLDATTCRVKKYIVPSE